MMIEKIYLKNFRNYQELSMCPSKGVNLIYGKNGAGKTNIIESIHYCSLGKSHRTNSDRDVVNENEEVGFCELCVNRKNIRTTIKLKLSPHEKKVKQFYIENNKVTRFSELIGKTQCVIFSPEDLLVIKESPALRRKLIDMMISQISTSYFIALQKYNKVLEQKNALLRNYRFNGYFERELYDVYNEQLCEYGSEIIQNRRKYIEQINTIASDYYYYISDKRDEKLSIQYLCCINNEEDINKQYKQMIASNEEQEMNKGTSEKGTHREDIRISLNNKDIKIYGSQGQIRTAALCLKMAQIELFYSNTGEYPVLLLDDVMSELDIERRKKVLQINKNIQTFITCTDESDIDVGLVDRKYYVFKKDEHACVQKFFDESTTDRKIEEIDFS